MPSTIDETVIMDKTRELCQAILEQPAMQSIRQRINAFMDDEASKNQYNDLVSKGETLQDKQRNAQPLSGEEIADFEEHRDKLLNNPIARGFLDAQEELQQVQKSVNRYVNKTLELGRLPTEDELDGCGGHGHGGCGCGHNHC